MLIMKGIGSMPRFLLTERAMGNIIAAPALLVIISVYILVIKKSPATIPTVPKQFRELIMPFATQLAKPELISAAPMPNAEAIIISTSKSTDFFASLRLIVFVRIRIIAVTAEASIIGTSLRVAAITIKTINNNARLPF